MIRYWQRNAAVCQIAYEKEREKLPERGDVSIVLDGTGTPRRVLQNLRVRVLLFSQMTWELAQKKGEDEILAGWQVNHVRFFEKNLKAYDVSFTPELPVVFEEFEMVYPRTEKS